MPRIQNRKEETTVELESGGIPNRGKGIAGWYTDRSSKKYSTRKEQVKKHQENVQNVKKSVAEHQGRESEYTQKHDSKNALGQQYNRDVYGQKDSSKKWI